MKCYKELKQKINNSDKKGCKLKAI